MTSAAAAAINSAPSSALSPHAAPFTLPARPGLAPSGRRKDGDASRSMDCSFGVCQEDKKSGDTHSGPPIACTVYPPSSQGMHAGQPSSWSGVSVDAYPTSTCSAILSAPLVRITSNYKQPNPLASSNGSTCSTLKIESPLNKTSETNKNSGFLTENPKSNKGTGKDISFSRDLEVSNPVDGNDNSQGTIICSKKANPVFNVKPLHIPATCADPCGFVANDPKPDPSECSVDSPCWRGASASYLSSFDVLQRSEPKSINQELEAFSAGQKQSSSAVRNYEAPAELQNLVTSKSKHNLSQSYIELGASEKFGNIGTNQKKDPHGKDLEHGNQCAVKCTTEQKHCLELRDNCMKRSGLNSAAPDFVPSSIGKPKIGKGPCSSTRRNILGILKAIDNLTEVLRSSYSDDEIELVEQDYSLLESLVENLETCLHKTRKGPIKGASDKAGLKAPHSQTTVLKSDAGKCSGSYIADGRKGIIVNNFAGSNHMVDDFGNNSLTRSQPLLNNFPKKISHEEEHSQVLVYKNLWIEAERANCELKYLLKHTRIKIDLESSMAHIGIPRSNSFHVSDLDTDPSNLYGAALVHPPMLSFPKDHPTGETSTARDSQNLLFAGDCIQSGGNGALSCSSRTKGNATLLKNLQGDHALGLEETVTHRHSHPGLQLAPSRAHMELNGSNLDGASAHPYIARMDGNSRGNSVYVSSDWEHVLMEEISWS